MAPMKNCYTLSILSAIAFTLYVIVSIFYDVVTGATRERQLGKQQGGGGGKMMETSIKIIIVGYIDLQ